jgi:hypothetical protein
MMDQSHAWDACYDSISATVSKKLHGWKVRVRNCLDLVTIGRSILTPLTRSGSAERSAGAWGAMGSLPMSSKWTKLAAAGALSLCTAVPALAGSVTQPGETVGLNTGAPLPQGWYAINTVDWGCRNVNPQHVCTGLTIPVVAWSTPWTLFGGRVQLLAAWPAVEVGVQRTSSPIGTLQGDYFNGMYNPAVFGQLAWDLGYGWGVSYLIGAYFDYSSPVAFSDTSLNQRFAISYTANDWAITANVIYGTHMNSVTDRPQLSGCPIPVSVQFPTGLGCNPDFLNVDLTVGHSFGKWQVAWVGFGSWDLNEPILGYQKQSQFAMGGLLGYDFGPVILQGYVTTDVYEKNYGGHDIRGWARIILPLNVAGAPFGPSAAAPVSAPVRGSR